MAYHMKTTALDNACVHGVFDSFRPEELEGKELMDFLPTLNIHPQAKQWGETDREILEVWTEHFKSTGVPYVVAYKPLKPVHSKTKALHVALYKEQIVDPYAPIRSTGKRAKEKPGEKSTGLVPDALWSDG